MLMLRMFSSLSLIAASCIKILVFNSIQSVNADLPDPRWGHSAALLKNKLYIYGGKIGEKTKNDTDDINQNTNQLLILDVSKSSSISNPAWVSRFVGPKVAYHTLSIGGPQNELLVLYGGEYAEPVPENPLFYYNTLNGNSEWKNVGLSLGTRRREHTAVTRLNDSMNYFFGGIPDISDPFISAEVQFQDLFKLDTRKNLWNIQNIEPNTPSARFHHTATILSDGNMYLVGGYSVNDLVDIRQIYVYDTINASWSVQNATAIGTLPLPRRDHAAVGTHDGKVIIHGGASKDYNQVYGDVAVLDTTQSPYTWNVIKMTGVVPAGRYSHTATMVGTNMMIAFGFLDTGVTDNNIYVLDTTTFTWKESYTPNNLEYTNTTPNVSSSSKTAKLVGSIIGAILFLALISALTYMFYRRRKRGSFHATPYSSTNDQSTSNKGKPKKFSVSSESTAVELSRPSIGSNFAVPIAETSESGTHEKDYSTLLEERMMGSDIQQTNFIVVPKSPLRITNPDERDD